MTQRDDHHHTDDCCPCAGSARHLRTPSAVQPAFI
jgi:hypothetical protein